MRETAEDIRIYVIFGSGDNHLGLVQALQVGQTLGYQGEHCQLHAGGGLDGDQ